MKTSENAKAERSENGAPVGRAKAGAKDQRRSRSPNAHHRRKWHLKNILVPTDFSDASKKALSYAVRLAQQTGGKITLLHVIEPMPVYPEAVYPEIMESDYWLVEAKQALLTQGKKAFQKLRLEERIDPRLVRNTRIRQGIPHQEITEAARELEADLIIIATNGRTGLTHVLLGSTTERVVRHAPCPVLVVREKEHEFIRS